MNPAPLNPSPDRDPFASVAPFYDLDLEGYDEDVRWYRELAADTTGAVLELGCGTGRVASALAADGVDVVGVDISAAMLELASGRSAGAGATWVEADLRMLDLERSFGLVLVPLGGLQHMESLDDTIAAFETIQRHLDRDGVAIVDVEAPLPDDFTPGPQPLIEHWTREWRPGADAERFTVSKLVNVEAFPSQSRRAVTWHFDIQGADAPLRRVTAQFDLRTFTAGELELAGRLAGLEVSGCWGDYELTPFDEGADRLLMAFSRPEDGA